MSRRPPSRGAGQARASLARSRLRARLAAVASGARDGVALDLGDPMIDTAAVVSAVTAPYGSGTAELGRIVGALQASGIYGTVLDQLTAQQPGPRARSATLAGALRIEAAVPTLVALLSASERPVRNAAARALGRIGGARSAAGLLRAVRHGARGPTIVIQLARAAPDLFLEAALNEAEIGAAAVAVAAAAGLRRRSAAVRPLVNLMLHSALASERAAGCRALGWIGDRNSAPAIAAALEDPSWRVRLSAAKALRRLRLTGYRREVTRLLDDPQQRVRLAARTALAGTTP